MDKDLVVIKPNRSWLLLNMGEIIRYRDLLRFLVYRDFVAKYKQTVLGPLWFIIQPLLQTLVFTVIFSRVAGIPTDNTPPVLFYLAGLLGWNYFAQTFTLTGNVFVTNAHLFGKVYFPRVISPLASGLSNMIAFLIQFGIFLLFLIAYSLMDNGYTAQFNGLMLLTPLVVIYTLLMALGFGLIMSSLTAKYRDFTVVMGFLVQLWMYASPLIYPLSMFSEKWRWVAAINPMSMVLEYYKLAYLGAGTLSSSIVLTSVGITAFVFSAGLLLFQRTERTFIDTV